MRITKRQSILSILLMITLVLTACNQNDPKNAEPTTSPATAVTETTNDTTNDTTTETTAPAETVVYPDTNLTKEDIIYFIMVDRFADSNPSENPADVDKDDLRAFQGGDIQGIIDNLDYIKSTGATAIWLTPIDRKSVV